jgi:hypothetical protein
MATCAQSHAQVRERLARKIKGGVVGPFQHVSEGGKRLHLYMERKVVRRVLTDQGDRRIMPGGGIHQRQDPAGAPVEGDECDPPCSGGDCESMPERAAQIKPNSGDPFGRRGRGCDKAIDCEGEAKENGGEGCI